MCQRGRPPSLSRTSPRVLTNREAPGQYGDDDGPGDGPFAQYEGDQEAVTRVTKAAVTSVTKRAVTRMPGTMTATPIGKMTTRAIKAASTGKAMTSRGNAMASANSRAKKPT